MYYKKEIGNLGEDLATKYLKKKGYKILSRNFRCKQGEIDIIAMDNYEFVFIEVKTRKNKKYGFPSEAVDIEKEKHIKKAIEFYIYLNKMENKYIRIDVIEIYLTINKAYINHIKQAIE